MKEYFYNNEVEQEVKKEIEMFIELMQYNLKLVDSFNEIERGVIDKNDVINITLYNVEKYRQELYTNFIIKNNLRYDTNFDITDKWRSFGRMLFADRLTESLHSGSLFQFRDTPKFRTMSVHFLDDYISFESDFNIDLIKNKVTMKPDSKAKIFDRIKQENTCFINAKQEKALNQIELILSNFEELYTLLNIVDEDEKKRLMFSFRALTNKNDIDKEFIYKNFLSGLK